MMNDDSLQKTIFVYYNIITQLPCKFFSLAFSLITLTHALLESDM